VKASDEIRLSFVLNDLLKLERESTLISGTRGLCASRVSLFFHLNFIGVDDVLKWHG
jgi:hypothetical protein